MTDELLRYEVSILIGPCSQEDAEVAAAAAHAAAAVAIPGSASGPGTSLNHWDEISERPGLPVEGVEVMG